MSDHETEVYSAVPVVRRAYKELVDGTLRVQIDITPQWKKAFLELFPDIDSDGALAPLTREAAMEIYGPNGTGKPSFKQEAEILYKSDFFRTPEVWKAVGSDAEYRAWVERQDCLVQTSAAATTVARCEGDVVAAHVRRIVDGAGTGIKPEYACVPLCDHHHRLQHQHGESAIGGKEYLNRMRIKYVHRWCWERTKELLGIAHWNEAAPVILKAWAVERNLTKYLPKDYTVRARD